MRLEFATATRIVFGDGTLKELPDLVVQAGNRVLLISGQGGANPAGIKQLLDGKGVIWTEFIVQGEPTISQIEAVIAAGKASQCDLVLGFGGGSVMDAAKAISAMLNNSGELLDYLEVIGKNQSIRNRPIPLIAIPTTAGTGSEVTRNAVITSPEHGFKVSMRSPLMLPWIALVDPELTFSLPPAVTASTGMDALAQVIEPYVSVRANPMTDLYCREGMEKGGRSLMRAYQNGVDREARRDMSWTSLLGGLALANAGLGAVHGFASPIGGMYSAPHGAVCARLLPPVMAMNVQALTKRSPDSPALRRYQEVAALLTGSESASIKDGIKWIADLCAALNIPGLASYGIDQKAVPVLVDKAKSASSTKANPIQLTEAELSEILMESL